MLRFRLSLLVTLPLGSALSLAAQPAQPKPAAAAPAAPAPATSMPPAKPADPGITTAEELIGRALVLRGFYLSNELTYQPTGKVDGEPKVTDWTLAGVNIQKATRLPSGDIELEGVRVAIRYNPDAHEFQRHPFADRKIEVLLKQPANPPPPDAEARQLNATFAAIFSIGIDPALQRSMPPLWQHYFDPNLAWPPDALTSATVYPMYGMPGQPKDVTPPALTQKTDATFTEFAIHDKVRGTVQLRMVVDDQGVPRRIAVTRPLGYGLEEKAAEAIARWRFTPAMRAGAPVPSAIVVNLDFVNLPPQQPKQ